MDEERDPDRLVLRRDAVRQGWSDDEPGRLVRGQQWCRLRRGAYLDGPPPVDAARRHRLLVEATVAALRRPAVVSHQSAAVSRTLHVHVARLRDDEVTAVAGIPVTTPVRTALDLARSCPFEVAVVLLDAALHQRLLVPDELSTRMFDLAGIRGSRAAARAVAFADGRSESVGESRSRVLLQRLELPPSALQFEVTSAAGRVLARADVAWEDRRVVGEFDGRVKYGRLVRPGQQPGDVVFAEKRREDAIRDEGWSVVRWTWSDLAAPLALAQRLRRALDRAPG